MTGLQNKNKRTEDLKGPGVNNRTKSDFLACSKQ